MPSARLAILTCVNPLPRPPAVRRILVIRLGAIGDVVRTLPAVSALRLGYPDAHLAWLVEPPSHSVLEEQPWIDEVLLFPRRELSEALLRGRFASAVARWRDFLRDLRAGSFDLALDFHSILRSALLARASGARLCVAYARPYGRELSWLFAHRRAKLSEPHSSRFERNLALVRFLAVNAEPSKAPFHLDRDLVSRTRAQLGKGPSPIAIHPGTSPATPHKRWSVEGFANVAKTLRRSDGLPAVVTFGPDRRERALAEAIVAACEGAARLAPATPTLAHLAALFSVCRLYVGGDTGPMHLAALVGTPVVQILGPTDPVENAPYPGSPSRSVRVAVACSPCRRGCAAATCMRVVEPGAVVQAVRELLAPQQAGW